MLGLGLDGDGKKRITQGPGFALLGGGEETHELMTETAIKMTEKLKKKGKDFNSASAEEINDIAHSVGLVKRPSGHNN